MSSSRRGFTLVEVLIASAIITVGLTAVAAGFQQALDAVEAGRQQTTALFLAEQRLEQVKAVALIDFDRVTTTNFPAEDSVVGYPQYRRIVEVAPGPAGMAQAVRVHVTVTYRPATAAPRMVTLATVLSRRP
jgi:prepilin-type N-terminal cleavage/methylation domain-containing protein